MQTTKDTDTSYQLVFMEEWNIVSETQSLLNC
jgi:hypothetical protein